MLSVRWRLAVAGLLATASLCLVASPATAIHQGATLDCGSAGTFIIKDSVRPVFEQVTLLTQDGKVVGTLVPLQITVNGEPLPLVTSSPGEHVPGQATCSFTGSNGDFVVLVGVLRLR
jgi:hypothetical protein